MLCPQKRGGMGDTWIRVKGLRSNKICVKVFGILFKRRITKTKRKTALSIRYFRCSQATRYVASAHNIPMVE